MKFDSSNWQGQGWDGLQAWLAPGTQPLLFKHYLAVLALIRFLVLSHSLATVNRFPAYINRCLQIVLLPGKSHGQRSLVGCSPWGSEELDTTERLHSHFSLSWIGEGNGNPLQCSCLENPRDGGAWWAAISGVTQSRTRLK